MIIIIIFKKLNKGLKNRLCTRFYLHARTAKFASVPDFGLFVCIALSVCLKWKKYDKKLLCHMNHAIQRFELSNIIVYFKPIAKKIK